MLQLAPSPRESHIAPLKVFSSRDTAITSASDQLFRELSERYRIEREIGRGGMATVYLAEDLKHHRRVAIKVLDPALAAALGPERFLKEIELTANLQHPHILPLFDSGTVGGMLYYVMPFVDGESLTARLRRETQLPVDDAVRITTEVASALEYAHRRGVIHRDIKPDNILFHEGRALVADFGIALVASTGERATATGMSVGTPSYMSPEQALAERNLTPQSDIYALGAMTYEMLAGEPPFSGPSAQAIIARVVAEPPRSLRIHRPSVPQSIESAVLRSLEKVPADRFATPSDFARALITTSDNDAVAGGRAPQASDPRAEFTQIGAGRKVRRRRFNWAGAAVLLVVLVSGGMLMVRGYGSHSGGNRRDQTRDQKYVVAVLPFDNLSSDTAKMYVAAGLTEEITAQLSRVSALRVLSRSVVGAYQNTSDRLPKMVSALGVGSVVEGSVRAEGDRARITVQLIDARSGAAIWSQQYDRQLTDLLAVQTQVARSITDALEASLTPDEARRAGRPATVNMEAYQLYMRAQGPSGLSPSQIQANIRLLQQAIALDSTFSLAYSRLARHYLFLAFTTNPAFRDSGLFAVRKAIAVDPDNSSAYVTLGGLEGESGHLAAGKVALLKAFDLNPNSDAAAQDLATTFDLMGEYDQALIWAVRAVALAPTSPVTYYHVGGTLLRLDDDASTERFLLTAEQRFGVFMRIQILISLLDALRGRNEAAMTRAHRILLDNPGNQEAILNAALLAAITSAPEAEALLKPLASTSPATRGELFPETMRTLYAAVLSKRGRRHEADSLWNSALDLAQRAVEGGTEAPEPRVEIAAINAMRGNSEAAIKWMELGNEAGFNDTRVLIRDPLFQSIRSNRDYVKLVSKMKVSVAAMRQRSSAANDTLFTAKARK